MEHFQPAITIASQMRVLLQNTETRLYFAGPNEWTTDSAKALDFEDIARASEVFTTQNLDYAQIILDPERPGGGSEGLKSSGNGFIEPDSLQDQGFSSK